MNNIKSNNLKSNKLNNLISFKKKHNPYPINKNFLKYSKDKVKVIQMQSIKKMLNKDSQKSFNNKRKNSIKSRF